MIEAYSEVETVRPIKGIPAGLHGTVLDVYDNGDLEVEVFDAGVTIAVATLPADAVRPWVAPKAA